MHVNIDEIKEGGLERAWDVPRAGVDALLEGDAAGYRARGPIHVSAHLRRVQERVLFEGHAEAALTVPCGRCLTPSDVDLPVDLAVTFVPVPPHGTPVQGAHSHGERPPGRAAASFDLEGADEEGYEGKDLDLEPIVREQLLLALPAYPVCQPACKGLCSRCGANLNERDCGCDRRVPDPRWASLEELKRRV